MPNLCSTAYVIDGDAKEMKQLYELMKGLEERETPSVEKRIWDYLAGMSRGMLWVRIGTMYVAVALGTDLKWMVMY